MEVFGCCGSNDKCVNDGWADAAGVRNGSCR